MTAYIVGAIVALVCLVSAAILWRQAWRLTRRDLEDEAHRFRDED